MRGKGWGKKHSTVDYVFKYPYYYLVWYHWKIIDEMEKRGYCPDKQWDNLQYRGKNIINDNSKFDELINSTELFVYYRYFNYPEHNEEYLKECIENLKSKGIFINMV